MKNIKDTQTAQNLLKAFAGESQARNRYTYYASVAKKEGYEQISNIFLETAGNESIHAKRFFTFLCNDYKGVNLEIQADYPLGFGNTLHNLEYAADGEKDEWANLYPAFGNTAEQEGFDDVAVCFRRIAQAEEGHETRFRTLLDNLKQKQVFKREEEVSWICSKCGFIHTATEAPNTCPSCLHPQAYFELFKPNY